MLTLNKNLFVALFLLISSALTYAQGDDFVDEDARDIEALEGKLQEFKDSQQEVLDDLAPEQVRRQGKLQGKLEEELQKAISSGDQKLVQELTKKLSKNVSSKASAKQMQAMVDSSLQTFRSMSEDQLRGHLLARTAGNPVGVVFEKYPKVLDYIIRVLQDPIALPQFFSILNDKPKLMIFVGINIILFFFGFILKRVHKAKGAGMGTHFKRWFLLFSIRLIVFLGFFHTEVGPFFFIAKDTFL